MKLPMTFCGVSITRSSSSSSTSRSSCRAMVEHARREDGLLLTMRVGGLGVGSWSKVAGSISMCMEEKI